MIGCEFCNTEFSTSRALKNHQKTAKYCLEKRGKEKVYVCTHCNKKMTTNHRLSTHRDICIPYRENLIERKYDKVVSDLQQQVHDYRQQIKELQDRLENIALKAVSRSTTTNNMNSKTQINNYIQNMMPVTSGHLLEQSSNLTLEHIKKGASGYAEYALGGPLKNRVACVDYSRRKIKFKDTEGNVITDPEMAKLAPMFFESIKDKSSQLVYSLNVPDMDSVMFEEVAKMFNTNADVKNCSSGIKSDFYHDFIRHVCSGSVVE